MVKGAVARCLLYCGMAQLNLIVCRFELTSVKPLKRGASAGVCLLLQLDTDGTQDCVVAFAAGARCGPVYPICLYLLPL